MQWCPGLLRWCLVKTQRRHQLLFPASLSSLRLLVDNETSEAEKQKLWVISTQQHLDKDAPPPITPTLSVADRRLPVSDTQPLFL